MKKGCVNRFCRIEKIMSTEPENKIETAEEWKLKGNLLVAASKYQDAIEAYTKAIDLNHKDKHACYGNRSMANLKLNQTVAAVVSFESISES